jgi:alpha-galactosidase/6-phospho-beta-glucosidase family protein
LRDRASERDLLLELRERIAVEVPNGSNPRAKQLARETGWLLVPGDDHTRDFLPPVGPAAQGGYTPWHGNSDERRRRLKLLHEVAQGERSWDALLIGEAWEKPLEFITALTGGCPASFHSLDLLNDSGQIPNLPRHIFVETPCHVSSEGVKPETVILPQSVLPLCKQTAQVTDTIVRAARRRSRSLVHEAVSLDPTILDRDCGIQAIDACLAAHADILPAYS